MPRTGETFYPEPLPDDVPEPQATPAPDVPWGNRWLTSLDRRLAP